MNAGVSSIISDQDQIIEEFSQFSDWSDKYEYLIDIGKALPPLDDTFKTDAYLVKGCQSKVWLQAEVQNDRLVLNADSDTVITKGIIALLIRVLSGHRLIEIENADLYFIEKIGLKSHLSPTRSNGLVSMIQHIKSYAKHLPQETNHEVMDVNPATQLEMMIDKIKDVYDPEIPVDIYELGLIYTLDIDTDGKVNVTMTLTSPACPVAGSLPLEVQEKLLSLPFVTDVELALVWDPPWNKERMSDVARMALDMF
jgi:cysteine desulfuration protein SufE